MRDSFFMVDASFLVVIRLDWDSVAVVIVMQGIAVGVRPSEPASIAVDARCLDKPSMPMHGHVLDCPVMPPSRLAMRVEDLPVMRHAWGGLALPPVCGVWISLQRRWCAAGCHSCGLPLVWQAAGGQGPPLELSCYSELCLAFPVPCDASRRFVLPVIRYA